MSKEIKVNHLVKLIKYKIDYVDLSTDLNKQNLLSEDILQCEISNNIILDIGWYGTNDVDGNFEIILTKKESWNNPLVDWETPLVVKKAKNTETLIIELKNILDDYLLNN